MLEHDQSRAPADEFLQSQIDTVPQLEALLLLWKSYPEAWTGDSLAKALFVSPDAAREIADDLVRKRLIDVLGKKIETYRYNPTPDRDGLIAAVDVTYRKELIRVSRLIHSKSSAAVREFAKAFRLKKADE